MPLPGSTPPMTPYGPDTRPLDRPRRFRLALLAAGLVLLAWSVVRPGPADATGVLGGLVLAAALALAAIDGTILALQRRRERG